MYIVVTLIHITLFKSKWGLRTRAVGEHPTAAESVGINVNRLRFKNVILAGAIAGLGGAFFTLGAVGTFSKEMTAGKGLYRPGSADLWPLEPDGCGRSSADLWLRR
jgi:general nucleoside transport system permease protein